MNASHDAPFDLPKRTRHHRQRQTQWVVRLTVTHRHRTRIGFDPRRGDARTALPSPPGCVDVDSAAPPRLSGPLAVPRRPPTPPRLPRALGRSATASAPAARGATPAAAAAVCRPWPRRQQQRWRDTPTCWW